MIGGQVLARIAAGRAPRRDMTIRAALEWAFATEKVSLGFDDIGADAAPGVDTVWVMMQRGVLGCRIDGGGRSLGHDDAEVIASILAELPPAQGGRGMAVQMAGLARAGRAPDWMPGAVPKCLPVGWHQNRHGRRAVTEVIGTATDLRRGRRVEVPIALCPVTYAPTQAQIAAARRAYLGWIGALMWLRHEVGLAGLRTIAITPGLPPMTPWAAPGAEPS